MNTDINFNNIREYEGSKQNAFEEMICQLARLNPPSNGKSFIRKDGSGGDAGVECYWICEDGTECGWQAKFFPEILGDSQWNQINESVKTAIEKHPHMVAYYVCLPKDRNDSRKTIKGKLVTSFLDKWNKYVEEWEKLASEKNRSIKFIYWGKSEIVDLLQKDDPIYAGKRLYWFNSVAITSEKLLRIAKHAEECLGERFTPEYHVELPISEKLEYISQGDYWKNKKKEIITDILKKRSDIYKLLGIIELKSKKEYLEILEKAYIELRRIVIVWNEQDNYKTVDPINLIRDKFEIIIDGLRNLESYAFGEFKVENEEDEKKRRDITHEIRKLLNEFLDYSHLFNNEEFKAIQQKQLLVTGEAGSGKSHLLCDFVLKRLNEKLPTVFLLGEHYSGGNPCKFIAEELGLSNYEVATVLGALDALGESYSTKTLIVIDAINEGTYRKEWQKQLGKLLLDLKEYENIGLIFSCRDTYKEFLISEKILQTIPQIEHRGFKGFEKRAALKYLGKQGVSLPAIPFLSPEFSNPLFLKITCKAIKIQKLKRFPKGLNGYNKIFDFYLESIQVIIKETKGIYRNNIIKTIVEKLVEELYPDNIWGIPVDQAEEIVNQYDNHVGDMTMFDLLVREGLLSYDVEVQEDGRRQEVVRFTYERFSDFAIARKIIDSYSSVEAIKKDLEINGKMHQLLSEHGYWGILKAIGIIVPEKFKREFINLIEFDEESVWKKEWYIDEFFKDVLLFRTSDSFTTETLAILDEIEDEYKKTKFDFLVAISTEPDHPWNALFLNEFLLKYNMPTRDALWSTYVSLNDNREDEGQKESPIRTIVNWVYNENMSEVDEEHLYLTAIVLIWCATTSRRMTRQEVTIALAKVLSYIPKRIVKLLKDYSTIDDLYLESSLYAAVYGAVTNIKDYSEIEGIVNTVIKIQFSDENRNPHILIRDYARGILEFAYAKKIVNLNEIKKYRPPYKSSWPIENPKMSEIDKLDGGSHSAIKRSVLTGLNDFGHYTMNDIKDWTATPLSEKHPKSCKELMYEFQAEIPEMYREQYKTIVDKMVSDEETEEKERHDFFEKLISGKANIADLYKDDFEDEIEMEAEVIVASEGIDEENGLEEFWKELDIVLDENQKYYLKWLKQLGVSNRIAGFDEEWGQRWVVKRCYEMGWTSELFEDFERTYCNSHYSRSGGLIERIGKKYQWIAYHELLGYLADNLYFKDRGFSDVDDSQFWGPWQIDVRELDPTLWVRPRKNIKYDDTKICWWRPYYFSYDPEDLEDMKKWLYDTGTLPDFKTIINVTSDDGNEWLNLHTFCSWKVKTVFDDEHHGEPQLWYRVNSCIISKDDLENVLGELQQKRFGDPHMIYIPNSGNQRFYGEYPWHPCYDEIVDWVNDDEYDTKIPCKYHVPLYEYELSTSGVEHMDDGTVNFFIPSKRLISDLNLKKDIDKPWKWCKGDEVVFQDPSMECDTQTVALFKKETFCNWLRQNQLVLIWLIGGEKELFTPHMTYFFGRLNYSALYYMDGSGEIKGTTWTEPEIINRQI